MSVAIAINATCSTGHWPPMLWAVTESARACFLAALGERRRADVTALPDWEGRLETALTDAGRTWSEGWLGSEAFAAEIGRHLDADTGAVEPWWNHLNAADLYLAGACARGTPAAIEKLESVYGDETGAAARRFSRQEAGADDLLQLLRKKLFLGGGAAGETPKIASYTGQGQLRSWLRVTATRTFIDAVRAAGDSPEVAIADELVAMLPGPDADPELELLKRQNLAHFKGAFEEAVGTLDSSERVVLRQYIVEQLSIDQIAALYHVHRATAARRVVKAKETLLAATRVAMARRTGLAPDQLDSALALIASRMEASVERLLK